LMMDAVIISETSVNFYETTQRNIPENIFTHPYRLRRLLSFQPNGYQDVPSDNKRPAVQKLITHFVLSLPHVSCTSSRHGAWTQRKLYQSSTYAAVSERQLTARLGCTT
jgi:hypothetical protein